MIEEKKKILIIDDDPDATFDTRMKLESGGYDVVEANSGKDGIEKAHTEKPDLMLVDYATSLWEYTRFLFDSDFNFDNKMELPKDSFNVIEKLREDEATKHIPMLVISPMDITDIATSSAGDGWFPADNILLKPIQENTLFSRMKKLLRCA